MGQAETEAAEDEGVSVIHTAMLGASLVNGALAAYVALILIGGVETISIEPDDHGSIATLGAAAATNSVLLLAGVLT